MSTILIIDDEVGQEGSQLQKRFEERFARGLRENDFEVAYCDARSGPDTFSVECALDAVRKHEDHLSVILLDIKFPDEDNPMGIEILRRLRLHWPWIPVLMYTTVDEGHLEDCGRLGSCSYILKRATPDEFIGEILGHATRKLTTVGLAPRWVEACKRAEKAGSDPLRPTVLVTGESGAGKEHIADAVHQAARNSNRTSEKAWAKGNCNFQNTQLAHSLLFGHARGSFTGAVADKKGLFESAGDGTVFLDEVADLPLEIQGMLLHALGPKGDFVRLGAEGTRIPVKAQVVAATNRDLAQLVKQGRFREDLYYRLGKFHVQVPPLRERGREEIIRLARYFLTACQSRDRGDRPLAWSAEALAVLTDYHWPGNVRELEETVKATVVMAGGEEVIEVRHLPADLAQEHRCDRIGSTPPPPKPEYEDATHPTGASRSTAPPAAQTTSQDNKPLSADQLLKDYSIRGISFWPAHAADLKGRLKEVRQLYGELTARYAVACLRVERGKLSEVWALMHGEEQVHGMRVAKTKQVQPVTIHRELVSLLQDASEDHLRELLANDEIMLPVLLRITKYGDRYWQDRIGRKEQPAKAEDGEDIGSTSGEGRSGRAAREVLAIKVRSICISLLDDASWRERFEHVCRSHWLEAEPSRFRERALEICKEKWGIDKGKVLGTRWEKEHLRVSDDLLRLAVDMARFHADNAGGGKSEQVTEWLEELWMESEQRTRLSALGWQRCGS